MKKIILALLIGCALYSCKPSGTAVTSRSKVETIDVAIKLVDVMDDKVMVTVTAPKFNTEEVTYSLPKIVPGTYSVDDYGKYIDDFKAFDSKGIILPTSKLDVNTWIIKDAKNVAKVTYLVNDTFDTEKGSGFGNADIFSPAGTNIDA